MLSLHDPALVGVAGAAPAVSYPDGLGSAANGTNTDITLDESEKKFGTASYSFNGSSSYVDIGVSTQFPQGADNRSVSLWFRTEDTSFQPNELFSWGNLGVTYNYVVGLYTNAGIFVSGYADPQWTTTSPFINYNDGDFHSLITTLGSGSHKIYIDGSLIDTTSATFDTGGGGVSKNATFGIERPGGSELWDGQIDDLAIFDRVLTPADAAAIGSGSGALANTIDTTGMLAYYNFDSTTGGLINQAIP